MSKVQWTKNQEKAIITPPSVLVNAAAGSGKTAVLVERIIRKIINGETNIERLLIVTFAKDAASGMQTRLKKAFTDCIKTSDDEGFKAKMRRELRLLNSSDITTIDAFCINVVRRNFHFLGIDPSFKIIDSEEAKIMLMSHIDEFINEMYENCDERIILLSDCYSNGFSDYSLKNLIKEIYMFTRSLPEPTAWLKESVKAYSDFKNSVWYKLLSEDESFEFSEVELKMYEEGIYPKISVLAEVISEFEEYYFKTKLKKNNFEFNDLEHLCYKLLKDNEDVRAEYSQKYDEILMDEYQDTNQLQESIFNLISDKKFMVGDMKQSIYRFRNSDPFIFKSCDKLFTDEPDKGTKILLSENFRSRPQVLDSINEIFSRIMSEKAGEVDYDQTQSLKWGNKSYQELGEEYFSELCILEGRDKTQDEDDNNAKLEARFIASKIRKMIDDGFLISDKDKMRPVCAGDFVIIQSSVKATGNIFISELKKAGLDGYSENEGYFDRTEIKLVLALIEIINNPLLDIPLVAVLRSVLFGFSEDDLAKIRLVGKGSFYKALLKAAKEETEHGRKCRMFCEKLERWRFFAKFMSSEQLIWTVYEETQIYDLMGIMYGGEEAQANLRLLFEKAKQYEKTGFRGLFNFLEYIKKMEENAKVASASLISDNKNAVRIMTIHKSKGLEFPVCIFSGAGKRFSSNRSSKLLIHKDLGIGIDFIDPDKGYFCHTPVQELIKEAIKREEQAETLRKLYVGMTRAKEKLIVVATVAGKKYDKDGVPTGGYITELEKWNTYYNPEVGKMEPDVVNSATRYIDLIAPIVISHKKETGWISSVFEYTPEEENQDAVITDYDEAEIPLELITELMDSGNKKTKSVDIPGKISVTGIDKLKKRFETEDDILDFELEKRYTDGLDNRYFNLKTPSFLKDEEITGAERGTAYHTLLSELDLGKAINQDIIKSKIEELESSCVFSKAEANCIRISDIIGFFETNLGKRLLASKNVLREEAFEIAIDADEVTKKEEHSGQKMLLQGVIDCAFEEFDGIVLVDYKTDRGLLESEFLEHYTEQLMWYKKAVEKLTGKKVKEAYLYSFELKKAISIF